MTRTRSTRRSSSWAPVALRRRRGRGRRRPSPRPPSTSPRCSRCWRSWCASPASRSRRSSPARARALAQFANDLDDPALAGGPGAAPRRCGATTLRARRGRRRALGGARSPARTRCASTPSTWAPRGAALRGGRGGSRAPWPRRRTAFARLERRARGARPSCRPRSAPAQAGPVVVVDRPEQTQSQVRLAGPAFRRAHPDYFAAQVVNVALGGGFTSRLVHEIRVKRGLSYGVGSSTSTPSRAGGLFAVSTFTKSGDHREILAVMLAEVDKMRRRGPTPRRAGEGAALPGRPLPAADRDQRVAGRGAGGHGAVRPGGRLAGPLPRPGARGAAPRAASRRALVPPRGRRTIVRGGAAAELLPQLEGLGPVEACGRRLAVIPVLWAGGGFSRWTSRPGRWSSPGAARAASRPCAISWRPSWARGVGGAPAGPGHLRRPALRAGRRRPPRAVAWPSSAGQTREALPGAGLGRWTAPRGSTRRWCPARRARMRVARPARRARPRSPCCAPWRPSGRAPGGGPAAHRAHPPDPRAPAPSGQPLLVDPAVRAAGSGDEAPGRAADAVVLARTPLHAARLECPGGRAARAPGGHAPLPADMARALELLRGERTGWSRWSDGVRIVTRQVGHHELELAGVVEAVITTRTGPRS